MLLLCADMYAKDFRRMKLQMRRQTLDIDEFLRRYDGWIRMVRREFYREECLHEQDNTGH